jgi:hypothetical protein
MDFTIPHIGFRLVTGGGADSWRHLPEIRCVLQEAKLVRIEVGEAVLRSSIEMDG